VPEFSLNQPDTFLRFLAYLHVFPKRLNDLAKLSGGRYPLALVQASSEFTVCQNFLLEPCVSLDGNAHLILQYEQSLEGNPFILTQAEKLVLKPAESLRNTSRHASFNEDEKGVPEANLGVR
jgi:hypothetical protein